VIDDGTPEKRCFWSEAGARRLGAVALVGDPNAAKLPVRSKRVDVSFLFHNIVRLVGLRCLDIQGVMCRKRHSRFLPLSAGVFFRLANGEHISIGPIPVSLSYLKSMGLSCVRKFILI